MAIKRYFSTKDNTITNAYKEDLSTRATGSNMGASDILEVFSVYGQESSGSTELSRVLIQFPVDGTDTGQIKGDRTAGTIPASGSVRFYLKMYNARHAETLPDNYTLNVLAVSQSWEEGFGLDMNGYTDNTNQEVSGSNWLYASKAATWTDEGGTYHTASTGYTAGVTMPTYTEYFTEGYEDLEVDVTAMVEEWIAGTQDNNGFGIFLTASNEAYFSSSDGETYQNELHNPNGQKDSFYTKKFFGRGSEFFFKRPVIEARWDSSTSDDRGNFYFSSSLASADNNLNTLYLYNYVRGQLQDIPDLGTHKRVYLSLFSGSDDNTAPSASALLLSTDNNGNVRSTVPQVVTGGIVSTGIYSASFAFTGSPGLTKVWDVWFTGSDSTTSATNATIQYHTGTIDPLILSASNVNPTDTFVTKISNLKPVYSKKEEPKLRMFIRKKDWCPTIYTKATTNLETETIDKAYYRVTRAVDGHEVISFGTASATEHTKVSFDVSGNYFDLDMSLLEENHMYKIHFAYYTNGQYHEQPEEFVFRVEEET